MSKYTTEVRFICETYAGYDESQGYDKINQIISKARSRIFDFNYPLYDYSYKSVLETKILKHYYTREIGLETVALWKHFLDVKMNEIMPYYNQLYESALIKFNPLYDVNITKDHAGSGTGKSDDKVNFTEGVNREGERNADETKWDYYSETPQGGITGLASLNYLTTADKQTDETEVTYSEDVDRNSETVGKHNMESTDEYIDHIVGKQGVGSYSKYLKEFRETFLNIDMMIINELSDLFMNLW